MEKELERQFRNYFDTMRTTKRVPLLEVENNTSSAFIENRIKNTCLEQLCDFLTFFINIVNIVESIRITKLYLYKNTLFSAINVLYKR